MRLLKIFGKLSVVIFQKGIGGDSDSVQFEFAQSPEHELTPVEPDAVAVYVQMAAHDSRQQKHRRAGTLRRSPQSGARRLLLLCELERLEPCLGAIEAQKTRGYHAHGLRVVKIVEVVGAGPTVEIKT